MSFYKRNSFGILETFITTSRRGFPFSSTFLLIQNFRWVTEEFVKYVNFIDISYNKKKENL